MSDPEASGADPPARVRRRLLRVALPVLVCIPLLLGLALLWRLSRGPISLNRFLPTIDSRVSETIAPFEVRLGDASLVWRGWRAPVEIATLPTGRLLLSQPDLIRGRLMPLGLQIHDARVHLLRTREGRIAIDLAEPQGAEDELDLAKLRDWFDPSVEGALLGRFSSLALRDATVFVEDLVLGRTWTFENVMAILNGPVGLGFDYTENLDGLVTVGLDCDLTETDFSLVDGRVDLEQGRVYADGIGVAADGEIDLGRRSIEMRGTVAPAATLQRVLGKLPLLGPVLTGTKGGGLVASRFEVRGPLDNPAIDVQSSSLLTPGILRELFEPREDREDQVSPAHGDTTETDR